MKDEFYNDPYLMDRVWYSPDNLMKHLTPEKIQWALCWGFRMELGEYPPRPLGSAADDSRIKGSFYTANWENNVSCIAWIRRLLNQEGKGGEMWLAHLDCPMFRVGMSIEQLSKWYGIDIDMVYTLMDGAIKRACKRHAKNKHL
uniref:Uncharacterized protein n=1 Tax=viral metagenome TaxID=1070528 RepID=A0A6M3LN65_9ZZZZ